MSTEIECYLCRREFGMSDKIKFIKFDRTTKMFHAKCRDIIEEIIEEERLNYEATDN